MHLRLHAAGLMFVATAVNNGTFQNIFIFPLLYFYIFFIFSSLFALAGIQLHAVPAGTHQEHPDGRSRHHLFLAIQPGIKSS